MNILSKDYLKKIFRLRGSGKSRENYLRLEKNERVVNFEKYFIKHLKNKISSYHLTSYPELEKVYLNLAKYLGVSKSNIVLTGGADLGIKNCFEVFIKPRDKVITITPTFAMIDVYSKLFQAKQIKFSYDKNLKLDISKIKKKINSSIKMIIISNPNNPTGTEINKKDLIDLIAKARKFNIPFAVDEVYYGFSNQTLLKEIKKFKNLIIIRTFSKSFGLAALRAGYLVADKKVADLLYKFKPMYEINSIAALAVNFILKNKKLEKKYIRDVHKGKEFLIKSLKKMNIQFLDTRTNFIHIKMKNLLSMKQIVKYLNKNKILIREGGPSVKGYQNYLRVTLGSEKEMKKLVFFFKKKQSLIV